MQRDKKRNSTAVEKLSKTSWLSTKKFMTLNDLASFSPRNTFLAFFRFLMTLGAEFRHSNHKFISILSSSFTDCSLILESLRHWRWKRFSAGWLRIMTVRSKLNHLYENLLNNENDIKSAVVERLACKFAHNETHWSVFMRVSATLWDEDWQREMLVMKLTEWKSCSDLWSWGN